ncbi:hypothetical protein HFO60_26045 [Rhizobium leguminosarum]|uniref:hypothetical protein n=1 Tax=Rhizobium leguminosarum TaxID=384 RepID=UPI001C95E6D4|nr:hypothetical protein [Rhizobium leguminosarum]MBY5543438.1 hypothetical protein [Rhizobium leguminosarum]
MVRRSTAPAFIILAAFRHLGKGGELQSTTGEPVERLADFIGQQAPTIIYIALRNPEIGLGVEIIGCFPTATPPKTRRISESRSGEFRDPEVGFFFMATRPRLSATIARHPDGKNRVGRRLTDDGTFHLDAGLEDQDCNLFWLIGSFVNLLSRQKGRVFGSRMFSLSQHELRRATQIRTRRVDTRAGAGLPASPITS